MMYRQLGHTDFDISVLCLGTMNFGWSVDEQTAFLIMDMAAAAGINFFDTADLYSSWVAGNHGGEAETILGKWLKTQRRDRVIIATKVRGRMWNGVDGEGLKSGAHHARGGRQPAPSANRDD